MEITAVVHEDRRLVVLSLQGKLHNEEECQHLKNTFEELLQRGYRNFVVDFEHCSRVSKLGVDILVLKIKPKVDIRSGRMKFCCLQPEVDKFMACLLGPEYHFILGCWSTKKEALGRFQIVRQAS